MYEYIRGNIVELNPASVVLEVGGVGYLINISLSTYSRLSGKKNLMIYVHQIVRDDAHLLYGFHDNEERALFRHLISVSGISAHTAIMMLSSLPVEELCNAIASENVSILKSIKGIGVKTAQRVIIDLKDKVGEGATSGQVLAFSGNTIRDEALSALEILGFNKRATVKALDKILLEKPELSVEQLVKMALKSL